MTGASTQLSVLVVLLLVTLGCVACFLAEATREAEITAEIAEERRRLEAVEPPSIDPDQSLPLEMSTAYSRVVMATLR